MSPFEYVSVLISIILGLGITVLLTGLADIIRHWQSVKVYWPYLVWILIVFILHIQEWWTSYSLRNEVSWTLPLFLFIISYPIILFVLAHLLFPSKLSKKGVDLKSYYYSNYPTYFGAALLLIIISFLQNHFLLNYAIEEQVLQIVLSGVFTILLIIRPRQEKIHAAVAVLMAIILLASFLFSPELLELK